MTFSACLSLVIAFMQGCSTGEEIAKSRRQNYANRCLSIGAPSGADVVSFGVTGSKVKPWQAVAKVTMSTAAVCSAVLVSPTHLITAAHCFENKSTPKSVSFGNTNAWADDISEIVKWTVHPEYAKAMLLGKNLENNPDMSSNDIAIIEIKQNKHKYAAMATSHSLIPGQWLHVIGYGNLASSGNAVKRMGLTHFGRHVTNETYSSQIFKGLFLLDSTTAAGTCPGDSGGGIFLKGENDEYLLVGLVSGMNNHLYPGFPMDQCKRCTQGLGVIVSLSNHTTFLKAHKVTEIDSLPNKN